MQITETSSEGLRREYRIVVPASDIESRLVGRLTEIGQTVKVPGFRQGKVPLALLKTRYGDAVRSEVLEQAINDSSRSALEDKGVRPALQPEVEILTFEDGADLEYRLAIEMLPELEPIDFSALKLERLVVEIGDEVIRESLERMAASRKSFTAVTDGRAAQSGDQVLIDFVGSVDGEAFEGGTANDFELELGAGMFIPGFEDQLIGAAPESKLEVKVEFPDDYPAEHLKGKAAAFDVALKEVRGAQKVEIDDELAKRAGLENLDALSAAVREQLEREYGELSRARLKRVLMDSLADGHEFEVPPGMVEKEFESIWAQVKEAIAQDQLDDDDKGKSDEELQQRYRPIAARRVRLGLLLAEVGRANDIGVAQEDLNRAMAEQARRFPGQEAQIYEYYQKNPEAMQELQAPIFEDKVVDFITEMADVSDRKVSVEELMSAAQEQESGAEESDGKG